MNLSKMGFQAKESFKIISRTDSQTRQMAVRSIARELEAGIEEVIKANLIDIQLGKNDGLSKALIDRLTLDESRLKGLVADTQFLADLPDPIGTEFDERTLPNGLKISRRRVALGVLGVIYESRPNVTIDVASLAVKTGNAAILRGGKETLHTNRVLVGKIKTALLNSRLPENCIQFIDNPDRKLVGEMLRLNDYIDVIVPRGGNSLHQFCRKNSTIPVITGGIGICHLYVDANADLEACLPLIYNAKTQRPSVCNSLDTLLVHESIAEEFLPRVVKNLKEGGVTFRAGPRAIKFLDFEEVELAGEDDFDIEWLSLVLGIKVVPDLDTAIAHIEEHSTGHSDGILTNSATNGKRFLDEVDSAAVYVNASTRFTDGAQLGLGAEVAVSTQRLHARGPMGLPELTTYKWVVVGDYTVRE